MRHLAPAMMFLIPAVTLPVMAQSSAPKKTEKKLDLLASVRAHVTQMRAAPVAPAKNCPVGIRVPSWLSYEAKQPLHGDTKCFSATGTFTINGPH